MSYTIEITNIINYDLSGLRLVLSLVFILVYYIYVLYCTVLYCVVLYLLYCTVLCCIVLYCIVLCYYKLNLSIGLSFKK